MLTFLGIEEEEGLVEGDGVVVGRRRPGLVGRNGLGDDDRQGDEEEGGGDAPQRPLEGLAAADYAAEVNVLALLLLVVLRPEEPALLGLVELVVVAAGRQGGPVDPVHLPAPVVVRVVARVRLPIYLERATPVVPRMHPALPDSSATKKRLPAHLQGSRSVLDEDEREMEARS